MSVSELTGPALDWAVAKCENYTKHLRLNQFKEWEDLGQTPVCDDNYTLYAPSTDWAQGGPIIERERYANKPHLDGWVFFSHAEIPYCGPTPLIAACRCYVASKLGDEIEIPKELL